MRGITAAAVLGVVLLCGAVSAFGTVIYPAPDADGMVGRDWWSSPNYYWVDNTSPTVVAYHDGDSRWWYRGMVIFNISSLAGQTLDPNSASYHFYSYGFSGVSLQYVSNVGSTITTAYGQIAGTPISALECGEGWMSFDVTPYIQSSINDGHQNVAFVLNATRNYGGGSLASVEDALGRGSYLNVVPEPASLALLCAGGLALIRRRSR